MSKVEIPSFEEWKKHAFTKISSWGDNPLDYTEYIRMKYDYIVDNEGNRSVGGKDKPIKRWRAYLTHALGFRVKNKFQKVVTDPGIKKTFSKMDQIQVDEILYGYSQFKEKKPLKPPIDKCFDYLLKKGVFQKGHVISKKSGKPWQEWYTKLSAAAIQNAYAYAFDEKYTLEEKQEIKDGKHQLCYSFVKIEALKTYFSRFNDRNQLKSALLALK